MFALFKKRETKESRVKQHLDDLAAEILASKHKDANKVLIRMLIGQIRGADDSKTAQAIQMLADADNFDVKALAIEYRPHLGAYCADQLMGTAREHLKHYGHGDRAIWARKRLILAKGWYEISGALTPALEAEIEEGLKKTGWVQV